MNKIIKSALVAGVMTMLLTSCGAQDAGSNRFQSHFSGQVPGEAQAILRRFQGSVTAVDPKVMTLTIKSAEEERVFRSNFKTKYNRDGKPSSLKDVSVGDTVEVIVNMRAQPDEAVAVDIKSK